MERSEVKILVVEDDQTLQKAYTAAIQKLGFQAIVTGKPQEALNHASLQAIHAVILDVLLPAKNGVDLAVELRQSMGDQIPIYLTSGVFKDKSYMMDAIKKTKAAEYITKPYNIHDLLNKIENALDSQLDSPQDPFIDTLTRPTSAPEKLKAAELTPACHGFELPRLIQLFMQGSANGVLLITGGELKEAAEIHFFEGHITKVVLHDPQSFFGALLIEKNFLTPEELQMALNKKSTKKIGERLVEENLISPHVINVIGAEQLAIRLSRLIVDTTYQLQWSPQEIPASESFIDFRLYSRFVNDWLASKISTAWLKNFYLPWMSTKVRALSNFDSNHPVFTYPYFYRLGEFKKQIFNSPSLEQLQQLSKGSEEDFFAAIHLLLLHGLIYFEKQVAAVNFEAQIERLEKLLQTLSKQDYFSMLGLNAKAKPNDIKKNYHDLAKLFHPDKVPPTTPARMKELTQQIFSYMSKSYETLSDQKLKDAYLAEIQKGQSEKILQSESLLEDAKIAIKTSSFGKAIELLQKASELRPPTPEIILYKLWARLATIDSLPSQKMREEIEQSLAKIPPEDRHTAIYYFVKGMFLKAIGDFDIAKGNFSHAASMDPNFVEAKRELQRISLQSQTQVKDKSMLEADVGEVFTKLFKKKK